MTRALCVSLTLSLAACAHSDMKTTKTDAPWSRIVIADGAANVYRFTAEANGRVQFLYEPINKEQSSSGMYDGGPPRKEDLAADDARLNELWALLQKLEADQQLHTPDRNKGTGAIHWVAPAGSRDFIIHMGAELNELLGLLKRFGG
ncbi:MAG: hypothetical protein Q8N23_04770 [Archangium sp.]|nr:hypothetical protein [Archangium sp.]MDP3151957.1 hypothetical protein [Archangium sp.]MDP3571370.1 hypothetical protein [Archangium sp.]